ncbi:MAG: hypothetical protein PHF24_10115 [Syntrophomonas sp.]|nr:hypothetical protein [Syntrophomonas sp.]
MPLLDSKVLIVVVLRALGTFWYVWAFLLAFAVGKIIYRLYKRNRLARLGVPEPILRNAQNNNQCVVCNVLVSEKVKQYCLDHNARFGGKVYCFQHQKGIK